MRTSGFRPPRGAGVFLALLLGAAVWAQAPEAGFREGLLRAYGPAAPRVERLYSESRITYFDPQGGVAQTLYTWTYQDLKACALRLEFAPSPDQPKAARTALVYTPKAQYLLQEGVRRPLPDELFLEALYAWQLGLPGLLAPFDRVEERGEVELPGGLKARAYAVERKTPLCLPQGVLETRPFQGRIYLTPEGEPLGEGYLSPTLGAETLTLYRAWREDGGVRYPEAEEAYLLTPEGPRLYARAQLLRLELNPEPMSLD